MKLYWQISYSYSYMQSTLREKNTKNTHNFCMFFLFPTNDCHNEMLTREIIYETTLMDERETILSALK